MKRFRTYLRNWLIGDLLDLATKVESLEKVQSAIESHLGSISSLAEYVKEKDEKASEMYQTIAEVEAGKIVSPEDLEDAIQNAMGSKVAIMESPAIGTREVIEKNRKLGEIDTYIRELVKQRG